MDEVRLREIGERFGESVMRLVGQGMARTVSIDSVEDGYANVVVFEGDALLRVPLTLLGMEDAMLRITPTVGSTAVIINLDSNVETPYFLAFESIDKVEFVRSKSSVTFSVDADDDSKDALDVAVGDSTVHVTSDEIVINGGDNKGLVITPKLTERLNKLESEIDAIQNAIMSHSHAVAGSATSGTVYAKVQLTSFKDEDYENDKVKQ